MAQFYAGQKEYIAELNELAAAIAALDGNTGLLLPPVAQGVVYNAAYTFDCSQSNTFYLTLLGNIIVGFANAYDGQRIVLRITQDAQGSRVLTFAANTVRYGDDTPSFSLSTLPNKTDYIGLIYNAPVNRFDLVAYNKGF